MFKSAHHQRVIKSQRRFAFNSIIFTGNKM